MRKIALFIVLQFMVSLVISAQNLLSPLWKISFADTSETQQEQFKIETWQDVNLLLSWERQGYFWLNGKCCIANDFFVPENFKNSELNLSISLQCNVQSVFINGKFIGGNLPNQFWSNRDARTDFVLQNNLIKPGVNRITIFANDLSYTGGRSYNFCSIAPKGVNDNFGLKISIPFNDHLYSIDDEAIELKLNFGAKQKGIIKFSIVNDFHESFIDKSYDVEEGEGTITVNLENEITQPGFYECVAIMNDGSYSSDVQWFALSPEKIECTNNTVPRFKQYWDEALADLSKVQPEFNMIKVDSLCSANRDGYIVEMKSLGGLTIRGYYFVPRTVGKHAAVLHVPGYGYGWQYLNEFLSSTEDVVELAICVRAHGISSDVFNPGFGVPGVWGHKLCSETENAYRAIYMDCVRAVEFLLSRPEVDASRIGVMGGSQGGGLTLATAGLCSDKIKACAYFDPFPCDTRDQLKIRTMCNSEIKNFLNFYNNECTFEDALSVQDLLDTKGFAKMIKCPAFFATALFDDDCPPHMGFAAYNGIASRKQFKIFPNDSHLGESNPYGALMQFLKSELKF
ncbi:MAG: acetylxylan esterase [bacterium]